MVADIQNTFGTEIRNKETHCCHLIVDSKDGSIMHEHFAIIDDEIVWYGSMNLLSRVKEDDNLIRVKSNDAAQELMEMTFA